MFSYKKYFLHYFEVYQQKNRILKCKHEDNNNPGTTKHAIRNSSTNASNGDTAQAFKWWYSLILLYNVYVLLYHE
jgi:hypothetical protein